MAALLTSSHPSVLLFTESFTIGAEAPSASFWRGSGKVFEWETVNRG